MITRTALAFLLMACAGAGFGASSSEARAAGPDPIAAPDPASPRVKMSQSAGQRRARASATATALRSSARKLGRRSVEDASTADADVPPGDASPATRPAQIGLASWYGGKQWQGHLTSDGSRFDENALTAAHATLPLGTFVRVRLMNSEREVVVRITDRPGTRRRIIDLSRRAASTLGILSQGIARVSVQAF